MEMPLETPKIEPAPDSTVSSSPTRVVVATTVMLSFISFWRAAAIVLNDLGSSAYYVGGIAEKAVGPAAPWFVLGVMLFSYAVRSVYIESCAMFTRGGVYRVVKEAMGGTLAKLSVSALIFDYILTGPISGVSAGQYIVGLVAQTLTYFGHPWAPSSSAINFWAAAIAVVVTLYFWRRNTRGLHESSDDALRIMYVTTVMVVTLILWSGLTILMRPEQRRLPPPPVPANLDFDRDAVGWLPNLAPGALTEKPATASAPEGAATAPEARFRLAGGAGSLLGLVGILIAFGHSLLAMSGEESLAQVNRELEYPKHKNLVRAGMVIFLYSLLFTSLVSFFAYAIIPEELRSQYRDNLISGISMHLVGPIGLRLAFQAFIVVVGFLMLAGAINTSIIGANGVLNRVSEDGVMPIWVREPHRKYGTSYRLINLIVLLQIVAIVGSRGETYTLGEAYAFGVIWSFAFKALAVMVLRFKDRSPREWKVPFNLPLDGYELPVGLGAITSVLFVLASVNLVTKQVATVSGIGFTLVFFVLFLASERMNSRRRGATPHVEADEFRLDTQDTILPETVGVRPGNALVLVRDYNTLDHLKWALEATHTGKKDLVVLTVRVTRGADVGYERLAERSVFASYEQLLFSRVVALAEKAGKRVHLLVVPSSNVFAAAVQTASQIESSEIVAGFSSVLTTAEQARFMGEAWERVANKRSRSLSLRVAGPDGVEDFSLGAHSPRLTQVEIDLVHDLWLELTGREGLPDLHHHEVVAVALARFVRDLHEGKRGEVLRELRSRVRPSTMIDRDPPAAGAQS
jgi:amino acid transporter